MTLNTMAGWLHNQTSEVVISSRLRISRNWKSHPFGPLTADLLTEIKDRLAHHRGPWSTWEIKNTQELVSQNRLRLLERGQLEPGFLLQPGACLGLSEDGSRSLSLGDQDHLRYVAFGGGGCLERLHLESQEMVYSLEELFPPAFDSEMGYLRADPRQCGTAMKPSVLLHLPASELSGMIHEVFKQAEALGYSIRGLWESEDEGSSLYQLAPYYSTGSGEVGALGQLMRLTEKVETWEKKARELLFVQQPVRLQDLCGRAKGILQNCGSLGFSEALTLLSRLRLGVILGIIKDVELSAISPLWYLIQKGHLRSAYPLEGEVDEDELRARLVKSFIDSK